VFSCVIGGMTHSTRGGVAVFMGGALDSVRRLHLGLEIFPMI
jgi:hypothetical protein